MGAPRPRARCPRGPSWRPLRAVGYPRGLYLGYGVGGITRVVFACGALLGAVLGFLGAAKLDAGDKVAAVMLGLGALLCGLMSVPFVGEVVVGMRMLGQSEAG